MDAPLPQNNLTLNIKSEENNKLYKLNIFNSSNSLFLNITIENNFPKIEYEKNFTIKELSEKGKFFKIFEDIPSIISTLKETFENKKPIIKENKEYIQLTIVPTLLSLGEINLIIPKKQLNDKDIINDLCNIINKQEKEIENLKIKISSLEGKIKFFEEIPIIKRFKNKNNLIGDIIKTNAQFNIICDWINNEKSFKFKLLYKGTTDGDTIEEFHNKCDNQYPTISIIESTDGQIFGGYTTKSWDKNNLKDIPDPDSFLFNLNNIKKYPVSNDKGLMADYICDFGGKNFHELWVNNQYFSNNGCCDNGKGYNFKNYELSGGKSSFKIKELEIYKVIEE